MKLVKYTPRRFFQLMWSYRPTELALLSRRYRAQQLTDLRHITQAKHLHAAVYLERSFVTKKDIARGVIKKSSDPYQTHSIYFGVIDGKDDTVVAVARQVLHDDKTTFLPIFSHVLKGYTGTHIDPKHTVEISAFTKRRGVDSRVLLLLFRSMLHASKEAGQDYWYVSCDSYVYSNLKLLFGHVLKPIGPQSFYLGSWVIPAAIDLRSAPAQLRHSYQWSLPPLRQVRKFLYLSLGDVLEEPRPILDSPKIPAVPGSPEPSRISFSAVGVAKTTPPSDKRSSEAVLINPGTARFPRKSSVPNWVKVSAVGTLVLWSCLKAGLVWGVFGAPGVNTIIFFCIDIVTIPLYVLGIAGCIESLVAKNWRKAVAFAAVTLLAFGLPYAYIYITDVSKISGRLLVGFSVFVALFFAIGPLRAVIAGLKRHEGGMSKTPKT